MIHVDQNFWVQLGLLPKMDMHSNIPRGTTNTAEVEERPEDVLVGGVGVLHERVEVLGRGEAEGVYVGTL